MSCFSVVSGGMGSGAIALGCVVAASGAAVGSGSGAWWT